MLPLAQQAGVPVVLSTLSAEIQMQVEAASREIAAINRILKAHGASTILLLRGATRAQTLYLWEPAEPHVILGSENYQLMRHYFTCKNHDGSLKSFILRDDEFYCLHHLIDQGEEGANMDELKKIMEDSSTLKSNDRHQLHNLVRRLNSQLTDSPLKIENSERNGNAAHYTFITDSRP